jgi:RNA polymerase sigma-70 factor (ECF subfamily)
VPPTPPDDRSDAELDAGLNAGDERAFDALYYRYRDWVLRLAYRFTGGHGDDALDVMQETFAYLFRKFPGFHLSAQMTTFLYPVVRNLSIAARRKRMRLVQPNADAPPPDPVAPSASDPESERRDLRAVLAALPEGQCEVLLMRFVDGMSLIEIGEALGVPEGTVKSRLHNALQTLRGDARARRYFNRDG